MDTLNLPETIPGKITLYRFELPRDEKIMSELLGPLYELRRRPMKTYASEQVWERDNYTWRPRRGSIEERNVHFELDSLFSNQWNVRHKEERLRYMDWVEYELPNRSIIMGYFVHLDSDLRQIRADWAACGYCGKREHTRVLLQEKRNHCDKCLASSLMEKETLNLTVYTTYTGKQVLPGLKGKELDKRWEQHIDKTFFSGTPLDVLKDKQEDVDKREERAKRLFEIERKGYEWLIDHGFNIKHVLFATHSDGVFFLHQVDRSPDTLDILREKLKDFPYNLAIN